MATGGCRQFAGDLVQDVDGCMACIACGRCNCALAIDFVRLAVDGAYDVGVMMSTMARRRNNAVGQGNCDSQWDLIK